MWEVRYCPAGGQRAGMNTCVCVGGGGRAGLHVGSEVVSSWWTEGEYEHMCVCVGGGGYVWGR